MWDYRLGDRDMVIYWTIGLGQRHGHILDYRLGTETWSYIGL